MRHAQALWQAVFEWSRVMEHLHKTPFAALVVDDVVTRVHGCMDTATRLLQDGIRAIPGMRVLGEPVMGVFAFTADDFDVYQLCDVMDGKGWRLDRQQRPPCLHMMVTPAHREAAPRFLADLRTAAEGLVKGTVTPEGASAMYGMLGAMEERDGIGDILHHADPRHRQTSEPFDAFARVAVPHHGGAELIRRRHRRLRVVFGVFLHPLVGLKGFAPFLVVLRRGRLHG